MIMIIDWCIFDKIAVTNCPLVAYWLRLCMQVRCLKVVADVHFNKLLPDTQLPEVTYWLTRYEDCKYSVICTPHETHMHTHMTPT